ncbi:beta-N-acetylhexosaminidase [Chitinophaga barathri]|uniref:beta-N-acetylhexosaminidase n=1 Tax=Chitinophaga barathri TaxID=1647451 RepID=A0A3N4M548_9BACT|nr:beta-N-acetylhexosaminidase [Chitinophaga barathri]RPD38108.1 beta-hexosaminidase [Chitinophaga barathri]
MIRSLFLLLAFVCAGFLSRAQQNCPVIPLPSQSTPVKAVFQLNDQTPLAVSEPSLLVSANMLQQQLLQYAGIRLVLSGKTPGHGILLKRVKGDNPAAYSLEMTGTQVTVSAAGDEGIFYGLMSFMQLVRTAKPQLAAAQVPCWNITDKPLFGWRGFMLDESRQFFGKAVVKKILDEMASYKLNRFHWHLTDEPGWRIEIKQYPRLSLVGGIGNTGDATAPAQYYTQAEIKEIVAYAKERHITVIPEIDMPGHATAANKAYPEFSGGGSAKYPEFTFNPGKEETYQYLANILKEVNVLFPSQMIHIGGDEVSFGSEKWKTDPSVQQLMKTKGYTSLLEVEHYFIKRMADTLLKLNSKVLGWDEVTAAELPAKETIVFWWRQEKPGQLKDALDKGYQVVLCPRLPFYFDFVQDSTNLVGRRWQGGFNPLKRVYDFSLATLPVPVGNKTAQVEGIQANLWTETIRTTERMYYMTFPRLIAFAEAAWTAPASRNFPQFEQRLQQHLPLLKEQGIYYMESPKLTPEPIR